jgi:hypothetical protein
VKGAETFHFLAASPVYASDDVSLVGFHGHRLGVIVEAWLIVHGCMIRWCLNESSRQIRVFSRFRVRGEKKARFI